MKIPCKSCPWRKTTRTSDIPGGGMDHVRSREVVSEDACTTQLPKAMGCHLGTDEAAIPCAGFVVQVGFNSIGLRIAHIFGVIAVNEYSAGGAELHASMEAMLAAHPDPTITG